MNSPFSREFDDVPSPRKPLWRRILKWAIRVVVALVVIAAAAWGILNYVSTGALESEISKLRAAGQPVTFAEREKSLPAVAEADDAAPFYKAALALRRASTDDKVDDLMDELKAASTQPATASAPSAAEVEQVLAANALALEMVDRGSSRPGCAFDFGLSHGIGAGLPQMSSARSLAKLLRLRTVWLARQGHAGQAVDSLVSSLRLLRMYDRQPVLITSLVKVACTTMFMDAIPAVLEKSSLTEQELAAIGSALAQADPSEGMERLWIAERVYCLELWRDLIRPSRRLLPDDATRLPEAAPRGLLPSPVFRLMIAYKLRIDARYTEAARKGWPRALEAAQDISRSDLGVFGFFIKLYLIPSYEQVFVHFGRAIGSVRSAQVAVMVERYRQAKGHLPASLQELRGFIGHDLPADPFTGKDLIYKVQGEGFLVYGLGENKADDGGPVLAPRKDWGLAVRWKP